MNLYEYQAKKLFLKFNLPVLKNYLIFNMFEIKHYIDDIKNNPPWTAKCQIKAGGRGKAGGILVTSSFEDILTFSEKWLGNRLITCQTTNQGDIVNSILIEPAVSIMHEFYLSVLIDRNSESIVCIISKKGGINIEDAAFKYPDTIYRTTVDPVTTPSAYQGRILASKLGLTGAHINIFSQIYINMIEMFIKNDLTLVEVNPLVITKNNDIVCLDAKVIVDQNSLFRHIDFLNIYNEVHDRENNSESSVNIQRHNFNYIKLDGNIGCMVNGAGLAMATMDLMKSLGGNPANFLDIGGDTNQSSIISAFKIILQNTQVKAILVNIFGGIVCCDLVANSIITAITHTTISIPIVIRLEGNNSVLGINRLKKSKLNVIVINNLTNAIKQVIKLVQ